MSNKNETSNKNFNTTSHKTNVKRSCNIVQYGEAERLCRTCGYVLWEDKGKSNEEILNDMAKIGYPKPDCMDNFA